MNEYKIRLSYNNLWTFLINPDITSFDKNFLRKIGEYSSGDVIAEGSVFIKFCSYLLHSSIDVTYGDNASPRYDNLINGIDFMFNLSDDKLTRYQVIDSITKEKLIDWKFNG